jgi:hypothetical protein
MGVRFRGQLCLLALALLAGCGESKETTEASRGGEVALPTPVESADSAARRLIDAARSGDCGRVARHIHGDERLSYCRFMKQQGILAWIAAWDGSLEVLGTAALGEVRDGDGSLAYVVLALDPQRRFKFITVTPQSGEPADASGAAAKVEEGIRALRDDDCEAFYRLSAQLIPAEEFCQATWVRDFQASVSAAKRVSEQSLGGNGFVTFFAVKADRSLHTVTMFASKGSFTWASAVPSS